MEQELDGQFHALVLLFNDSLDFKLSDENIVDKPLSNQIRYFLFFAMEEISIRQKHIFVDSLRESLPKIKQGEYSL